MTVIRLLDKLNKKALENSYKIKKVFLALLCATAQQSYCRHVGVRPSSVVRP